MTRDPAALLTFEAAAARLGVSHRYIDRLAKTGQIEVVRLGRLRRVREGDVVALAVEGAGIDRPDADQLPGAA